MGDEMQMDVRSVLKKFVTKNFLASAAVDSFDDADSFLEKGIIDSTGILELVSFVEEEFKIEVKDEDLVPDNFDSVSRLSGYVTRKIGV